MAKYLRRWGFTPQCPVKRALEQNPEAVRQWLEQDYPRLRAQAAREGAVIYRGDETAVREEARWVRGYAPRGQTPVWAVPARWATLSMISAIFPQGKVAFQIVEGGIDAERFIAFLTALIQNAPRKIYLVVDEKNSLMAKATAFMERLRQMPHKVTSYFRHPSARYAMSGI